MSGSLPIVFAGPGSQERKRLRMKVLVYGAGVIGSYLAHVLYAANHDISMLARGTRKAEFMESTGTEHIRIKVKKD